MLRLDLVEHSHFAGLAKRVFIFIEILLRHLVDVGVSALFSNFFYSPANLDIAVRVLRIHDGEGNTRFAAHIAVLLAAFRRVEDDVLAVVVNPNWCYLWTAVGHEGCEVGEGGFVEQIAILLGNSGHLRAPFTADENHGWTINVVVALLWTEAALPVMVIVIVVGGNSRFALLLPPPQPSTSKNVDPSNRCRSLFHRRPPTTATAN